MFERDPQVVNAGGGTGKSNSLLGGGDAIDTPSGKIDVSFLDALYAARRITAEQRDQILSGKDPSLYITDAYELNVLTVGRLGSKVITPAGSLDLIAAWIATSSYKKLALVQYKPAGCVKNGLYQATADVAAGVTPLDGRYWLELVSPGPVVLFEGDILSPVLAAVAAAAGVLGTQTTAGAALTPILLPPPITGFVFATYKRYKVTLGEIRVATPGTNMPTNTMMRCQLAAAETMNADQSVNVVFTPLWHQLSTAVNQAIAGQTVGFFSVPCRIEMVG